MERWRVKQVLNALNGSTLLGLAVALLGGARPRRGPRGLVLAGGYRLGQPAARAFTMGNVITTRREPEWLLERPALLSHEERHTWQYVVLLGLPFLPLYFLAAGWSWLRGGDFAVHNAFERLAGLEEGGYPTVSAREQRRRSA